MCIKTYLYAHLSSNHHSSIKMQDFKIFSFPASPSVHMYMYINVFQHGRVYICQYIKNNAHPSYPSQSEKKIPFPVARFSTHLCSNLTY